MTESKNKSESSPSCVEDDHTNTDTQEQKNNDTNTDVQEQINNNFEQYLEIAKQGKFNKLLKIFKDQYKMEDDDENMFALRKLLADAMLKNNKKSDAIELYKQNYQYFISKETYDEEEALLLKLQYKIADSKPYDIALCFVETEMAFTKEENKSIAKQMKESFIESMQQGDQRKKFNALMKRARKNLNSKLSKQNNNKDSNKNKPLTTEEIDELMDKFDLN